jgi:ubiquinone/menaquinone biosynthesis C-methylase UbiE
MVQWRMSQGGALEKEIRTVLEAWNRATLDKDVATAARLRLDSYAMTTADGGMLTRADELALIGAPELRVDSMRVIALEVHGDDGEATAVCSYDIEGTYEGERLPAGLDLRITFVKEDGNWRARCARMTSTRVGPWSADRSAASPRRKALARLTSWLRLPVMGRVPPRPPTFQELAYQPYRPGRDFAIAPQQGSSEALDGDLPIPPEELRTRGYLASGRQHVAQMRKIVEASGCSFEKPGRILDFGCGAGRMIRHFRDVAGTCEIWGIDISAEHIYWCKQHLSPPFHFATTTKVPHLPFEDRSVRFIYCGSVFTHIDDLADAWLLELRRILAPGGRLYLTIHDEHTVALFESGRYDTAEIVRYMKSAPIYQEAKQAFEMFTIGRDNASQIFYDLEYFSKSLRPIFDILSVTREAYFYQTAILLTRKSS